jgi:hypothetical protein
MSFLDELTKATNLFDRASTGYAVQERVNKAASTVDDMRRQLNDGHIKEQEFRKQSSALARDLQAQLVGIGADTNDIQQAFKAIAPQNFQSPLQAQLAGETEVAQRGRALQREQTRFQTDEAIRLNTAKINAKEAKEAQMGILIPDMKPIKGVSITKDSVKKVKSAKAATDSLIPTLKALTKMFKDEGTEFAGPKAAKMEQLVRDAQLIYKSEDFAGLGVLTGPDLRLLEEILPDLTSAGANIGSVLSLGYTNESKLAKLQQITGKAESRFKALSRAHGFESTGTTSKLKNTKKAPSGAGNFFKKY